MLEWILARAKERSTWLGLIALLTSVGVSLEPTAQEAIVTAGVALAGMVAVLTVDPGAKTETAEARNAHADTEEYETEIAERAASGLLSDDTDQD